MKRYLFLSNRYLLLQVLKDLFQLGLLYLIQVDTTLLSICVSWNRYDESCNIFDEFSDWLCVPNKIEKVNVKYLTCI